MFKKFFLLLIVAMLNVVAWADPALEIIKGYEGDAGYQVAVGSIKFAEPTVRVMDGTVDKTAEYRITYSVCGASNGDYEGTESTTARGIAIVTDDNALGGNQTGTTVEKYYGDVIMGKAGTVYVKVTATNKATSATLTDYYKIVISAPEQALTFTPSLTGDPASVTVTTKDIEDQWGSHSMSKATWMLPKYAITMTSGGTTTDITDHYDLAISYTHTGSHPLQLDGTAGDNYKDATKLYRNAETPAWTGSETGTLTYTFTIKSEYAGYYTSPLTKTVNVTFQALATETAKESLTLNLTRNHFTQENVTQAVGVNEGYITTHIYKYGQSDIEGSNNNYQYKTPTPSLLSGNAALPINVSGGGGMWGDFKLIYQIVSDKTYYDDCQYLRNTHAGTVQPAGEKTDFRIDDWMFQVSKPGLIKVAVYAVLDGTYDDNGYGANLKAMYEPYKEDGVNPKVIIKDYATYTAYTAPQYFYVDVMKRQPSIVMTPDPSGVTFLKDDVITMNGRIEISAEKGDDSNGIEGALKFGANDGSADHFAYQFFISDRNAENHINITWPNDQEEYMFIDWFKTGYKSGDNEGIQGGDIIKTGSMTFTADGDLNILTDNSATAGNLFGRTFTVHTRDQGDISVLLTPGNVAKLVGVKDGETVTFDTYELVTAADIAAGTYTGTHPYLIQGDYERGTTYNSMKGYRNENWQITFTSNGEYNIPYIARPWNHVRWDNSDEKTITFRVISDPIDTEIKLEYYYKVVQPSEATDAPIDKVVVPNWGNFDVTEEGGFRDETNNPKEFNNFSYTFTGTLDTDYTVSAGIQTHTATGSTLNTSTGAITIGGTTGSFTVQVSTDNSGRSDAQKAMYNNPSPVTYTIRIVSAADMARWEVISGCKDTDVCEEHETNPRFDPISDANGRMHFLTKSSYVEATDGTDAGLIYGGTLITGVPGITMTIGAPSIDPEAAADWEAIATTEDTKKCCNHETRSVIVRSTAPVVLDQETKAGIPTGGAFYKFTPLTNGFLTIDAKLFANHTIVLISQQADGTIVDETTKDVVDRIGDYTFTHPLLVGQTYYLYDVTNSLELNLHGFKYTPAFVKDRNTTLAESQTPIVSSTFMNGLVSDVPKLIASADSHVTFSVTDEAESAGVTVGEYLTVGEHTGDLTANKITIKNSSLFKLRVKAVVASTDASLGSCVSKTTYYHVQVVDIPTYFIPDETTYNALPSASKPKPRLEVTTENISSDITMTFGGWLEDDSDNQYSGTKADAWDYKSKGGPASRIGSELEDDDPYYNKTIDGFDYFNAGNNNPVDERNNAALQNATISGGLPNPLGKDNGGSYTYGSGTEFEEHATIYYNTTYDLPCRGAFLKFEPRESGTLLVYLVQNGACDYHEGIKTIEKQYQVKWRPLYITDETGKPVTMNNDFSGSQFVPTGSDATNRGSYTLGVSRCGKNPTAVRESWDIAHADAANVVDGCAFDWSEFKGTAADRTALLAAWPEKGYRESIIRLTNGGFVLPHKAYVRYAFEVKAGKTYFVFQPGSKPEFGGFSFLPVGFPDECKYAANSKPGSLVYNDTNQEKNWSGSAAKGNETNAIYDADGIAEDKTSGLDINFTWDTSSTRFTANKENLVLTVNDRRNSEIGSDATIVNRAFTANEWESLCLPFSVSEREMKRVFGDGYVLLTCDGVNADNQLHFVRHANRYVEAGRPYLIKPTQNLTRLTFHNVSIEGTATVRNLADNADIKVTNPSRFDVSVNDDEFIFKGTLMRTTIPEKSIFAQNEGLYITNAKGKIGGYRAFFEYQEDNNAQQSLSLLAFDYDDMTPEAQEKQATGVIIVDSNTGSISEVRRSDAIYNVNGQKLSDSPLNIGNMPRGVYVVGGNKYVK